MARVLSTAVSRAALSFAALWFVVTHVLLPSLHLQTFTGVFDVARVEMGCPILKTAHGTFLLATNQVLEPGVRVTVKGYLDKDSATFCMVGPIIEAVSVHPATSD